MGRTETRASSGVRLRTHPNIVKGLSSQSYGFSSSHVGMWALDHKEGQMPKNWCFQTVVLEKTLQSPLDIKEIKPVNPKENQPWIFIGRTDAEALILWTPDARSPDATHRKRPGWWEKLRTGGEGGDRAWDGWMTSWTQWTWVWANSRRWWRTGKPGMLQSMGLPRVRQDWLTEQEQNKRQSLILNLQIYLRSPWSGVLAYSCTRRRSLTESQRAWT